jgi:hypothetical protein
MSNFRVMIIKNGKISSHDIEAKSRKDAIIKIKDKFVSWKTPIGKNFNILQIDEVDDEFQNNKYEYLEHPEKRILGKKY